MKRKSLETRQSLTLAPLVRMRHTFYRERMTMMSFRVSDDEASQAQRWANELGIDKSELLRQALHSHLVQLASQNDAATWEDQPLTSEEAAIGQIADWGPAEDWSDWAEAGEGDAER